MAKGRTFQVPQICFDTPPKTDERGGGGNIVEYSDPLHKCTIFFLSGCMLWAHLTTNTNHHRRGKRLHGQIASSAGRHPDTVLSDYHGTEHDTLYFQIISDQKIVQGKGPVRR